MILTYFVIRLGFFAITISPFAPPDEVTHFGVSKVYSTVFLLPDNTPESYRYGLVTNIPWLYYWLMGKLLHLNFFGIPDLVFLRLLNIPLAVGTVLYARRTLLLITRDRLSEFLLLVVMTNMLMFSFLSASVTYDNLTNLLAMMSVYHFSAFLAYRNGDDLVVSILCQMAGVLTKVTFLPLALVLNLVLVLHEARKLRAFPAGLREWVLRSKRRAFFQTALLILLLGLSLHLYGGNYLKYGSLAPGMAEVLTPAAAMEYRIAAREAIFRQYTEGKISYMQALQMVPAIKHSGDISDTFYMLMNYEKLKQDPSLWMTLPQYAAFWFQNITGMVFGIKGHLSMYKPTLWLIPVYSAMALAAVGFFLRGGFREEGRLPAVLTVIALFYCGYLFYKVNYSAYTYYGVPGITLQGRYIFPVLGIIAVLFCRYLIAVFKGVRTRTAVAAATGVLFVWYDFPWFLMHVTADWFRG
ncbi:MAG TPA: hypothetical protein VNX25_08800 [Verrucomicrobiae bacterium]|nr:hypothetical protein [Verrucomicrobiae bacterium]